MKENINWSDLKVYINGVEIEGVKSFNYTTYSGKFTFKNRAVQSISRMKQLGRGFAVVRGSRKADRH